MERAAYFFDKAVQTSPENLRLAFLYAQALFMAGQAARSDEVFERALLQATPDMAAEEMKKREVWRRQAPAPVAAGAAQ